jgi:Spy/CpxP family protein refolding chaperone
MKVFARSAAALAVAALFPVVVAAQQAPPQGRQAPQARQAVRAVQRPQLTEQQREQIRTFDEQHRQSLETTRRELGDLHRQLDEALTSAQIDNGKVNNLRSSIVQKETALAQARVDRLSKLASVLTAEQRQAFRGRGLGQMFGPGGPGRAGGRGGAMAGPRDGQGRRAIIRPGGGQGRGGVVIERRQGVERQMQMRRPGGGRGTAALRERRGDDNDLRAEIRRLEAQLEALRRRIR